MTFPIFSKILSMHCVLRKGKPHYRKSPSMLSEFSKLIDSYTYSFLPNGKFHALTTCTDLYFRPKLFIISNFIVVIIPMLCEQLPASYGLLSGSFSLTTRSAAEPLGLAQLPMCRSTTQADLSTYHSGWVKTTLLHLG